MDGRNDAIVQNSFSDEQLPNFREATGEETDLKHILACNYRTVLAAKGVCVLPQLDLAKAAGAYQIAVEGNPSASFTTSSSCVIMSPAWSALPCTAEISAKIQQCKKLMTDSRLRAEGQLRSRTPSPPPPASACTLQAAYTAPPLVPPGNGSPPPGYGAPPAGYGAPTAPPLESSISQLRSQGPTPPDDLTDQIFTYNLFVDPVVADDGFTYERFFIEAFWQKYPLF